MAAVAPSAPANPTNPATETVPPSPLSWEGEKMFNIYIHDYCYKRGFRRTARELLIEADIPHDSQPPINARQGLLFEWWSVFWVLFQAKSNNGGSEDALLYIQHQQQLQQQRNARPPNPPVAPSQVPGHPPQPPIQRQPPLPINGMVPNHTGQPQIPVGGSSMVFSMGGAPGPQVNGVQGSHPPTPQGGPPQGQLPPGPHPPGPQQPNFNAMRPLNGPQPPQPPQPGGPNQPQQRPMASNLPFQSPTMNAHSPNAGPGLQGGQGRPGGPQPPMGNLGGMQSMNPAPMMPPNAGPPNPQGMMMGQPGGPMPQGGAPNPPFQTMNNVGRPPSRTQTPQMQGMLQQSPSMAPRNIPDQAVQQEFAVIPQQALMQLKAEVGLGDKDLMQLTLPDKRRIVQLHLQRRPNAVAGPSNPGMPQAQQQRPPQQPPQRGGKRSSTSPGEEHETLPRTDSSPPERKRMRRSPQEANATIPKNSMSYPPTPQQGHALPQQPGGPQVQPPGGPMQPQMQNGRIPPPAMSMGQGQSLSPHPQMQPGQTNPQGHMGQHNMMMQPNQMPPYRVPLHQVHMPPQNAGSPAGTDPQFNPAGANPGQQPPPGGPQFNTNRMMGQKPPHPGGMMPPPSPANTGKDAQGKDIKMDGSPSTGGNQQGGPPPQQNPGQQAPPPPQPTPGPPQIPPPGTPASQPQQPPPGPPQQQQNSSLAPPPPPPDNNGSGGMLGVGTPGLDALNGLGDPMAGMFGSEFGMTFDPSSFDGGIDFERDFRQWFNPSDTEMSLGDPMK